MLTVFLDIDGVLRRIRAKRYQLEPRLVENLERWVMRQEQELGEEIEIVISSSWKDAFSIDHIRSLFPLLLRLRIVGTTPTLHRHATSFPRYEEILMYNRIHGTERWIAFDDQPDLFPPIDNLIVVNGDYGFPPLP